jgi:multimeric flavodoxin WrbA
MKDVYSAIDGSCAIVFASPLYFYSWSSQIKPVWDRLIPYFSPNSKIDVKGRKSVLIATAGEDDAAVFDGIKQSFELSCKYIGWNIAGELLAGGVYDADAASGRQDLLDMAFELGENL